MAVVTTDFNAIQTRNIDPHSPVTSDNHNKLLKTFGTSKMYVSGFDQEFERDTSGNRLLIKIHPGVAFVQYMVIEMTATATLELVEFPCSAATYYIVLEYTYRNIQPVPIAYLKVIRSENYTKANQLLLYEFKTDEIRGSSVPEYDVLNDWFYVQKGHYKDHRKSLDNTPYWANETYLRLDGQNQANANLKMDAVPTADNDITNKAYVDDQILKHHQVHYPYFVQKDGNSNSDYSGKVIETIDIAPPSEVSYPFLKLTDRSDQDKGLIMKATGDYASIEVTKDVFRIAVDGQDPSKSYNSEAQTGTKVEINSRGITGALWCADIAEYFTADDTIEKMPEEGTCICIHNGKAVISSEEGDPSVIGCVSYHPAHILGGSTDFEKEFKNNHKIPVAILGQIKNVPYYSDYNLDTGGLLISGRNGMFKVISSYDPMNICGLVIGKTMNSVYPKYSSDSYHRVDVVIK